MTSQSEDASIPAFSWYPNITPYRLLFFATTGGLGIGKALLVSRGETASSTTVEWITGVVVALFFQFLGSYEYDNTRPQYWDWVFCYHFLGRAGRATRHPHSYGVSFEPARILHMGRSQLPPLVTAYRLLVSGVFTAFGLAKMLCGYLGLSSAMNTLDWVIAVPLTLGLYYIGLYEENKPGVLRRFFDVDYSAAIERVLLIGIFLVVYLGGTVLCIFWIIHWLRSPPMFSKAASAWKFIAWSAIFERLARGSAVPFSLAIIEIGIVGLGVVLWPIIQTYSGRRANSIRYYTLIAAYLTFYALLLLTFLCMLLAYLSLAMAVYEDTLSGYKRIIYPLLLANPFTILTLFCLILPTMP